LSLQVEEGIDQNGIILFMPKATAQITGWLRDEQGHPLPSIDLGASVSFPARTYASAATTDGEGRFALPAFDGDWIVTVVNRGLNLQGYQSLGPVNVPVRGTNAELELVAHRIAGNFRVAGLTSSTTTNGLVMLRLTAQTDATFEIQSSTDLRNWPRVTTLSPANGEVEYLTGDSTTNSTGRFYRARWVPGP
jgi:hypothetical protein